MVLVSLSNYLEFGLFLSSFLLSCVAEFFFSKLLPVLSIRASRAEKLVLCVALVLVSLLGLVLFLPLFRLSVGECLVLLIVSFPLSSVLVRVV